MSLLLGKEFFPDLLSIESHFYQFNFIYYLPVGGIKLIKDL